jgi:ribonuclease D
LYDELRIWRGRVAKRDGLPPYVVLTNREIAEIAGHRPVSLAALQDIEGFGEAKSKRWGEEILAALASVGQGGRDPAGGKVPGRPIGEKGDDGSS